MENRANKYKYRVQSKGDNDIGNRAKKTFLWNLEQIKYKFRVHSKSNVDIGYRANRI